MSGRKLGILHPGAMGASLARAAHDAGCTVSWASEGRSGKTAERASDLKDAGTLAALCGQSDIIISVCPPGSAGDVARQVIAAGFKGIYSDANAIAPARSREIAHLAAAAGMAYVDGGIIGPPAWQPGTTCLYLSGPEAGQVEACFRETALEVQVIGDQADRASALKMCYAAQTKGTTALICSIVATADRLGVLDELMARWGNEDAAAPERMRNRVRGVTAKAWRFEGEMREIADTFAAAGVPDGFHRSAAEIFGRIAAFKDAPQLPEFEEVLTMLGSSDSSKNEDAAE